jgi:hypothetical protein
MKVVLKDDYKIDIIDEKHLTITYHYSFTGKRELLEVQNTIEVTRSNLIWLLVDGLIQALQKIYRMEDVRVIYKNYQYEHSYKYPMTAMRIY